MMTPRRISPSLGSRPSSCWAPSLRASLLSRVGPAASTIVDVSELVIERYLQKQNGPGGISAAKAAFESHIRIEGAYAHRILRDSPQGLGRVVQFIVKTPAATRLPALRFSGACVTTFRGNPQAVSPALLRVPWLLSFNPGSRKRIDSMEHRISALEHKTDNLAD